MINNFIKEKNFWFLSRRRIFIPVFCEYSIFFVTTYILKLYDISFLSNDFIISTIIINLWIFISYLIGKYHIRTSNTKTIISKIFFKTTLIYLFLLIFYIFIFNFFKLENSNFSISIFIFSIFSFFSFVSQIIISKNFYTISQNNNTFLFIGDTKNFRKLKSQIKISDFNFKLIFYDYEIKKPISISDFNGIIIDDSLKNVFDELIDLLLFYKSNGIKIYNLLNWCNKFLQRFPPELIKKIDLINIDLVSKQSFFHKRLKRSFDIIISIFLLIFLSPLLLIIGLMIYLEDKGPIFFSQKRTGHKGSIFNILKFRTMKVNAESSGPKWAQRNDSRVTKIGRYLRLFRIDELPQLIYVFKGTMTLIGPRPERPEFDTNLSKKVPHYSLRYLVKPGLSGWAQVNYPYGASEKDAINKLSYDLYYLKNISIRLDILIFIKTIRLVLNKMLSEPSL
ncbi:MAG: sugar transferase [Euryarchaeota archaeon]|nr:sugar transferase [Euryarchaeota archaeon]|tara:strand:- start:15958 stop:17310 length:1353 start_codon:yes stop_codon:yes gene_type:complete